MPTSSDFPVEIWSLILKDAQFSMRELGRLTTLSKTLYTAIVPVLYTSITLEPLQLRSPLYDAAPVLLRMAGMKALASAASSRGDTAAGASVGLGSCHDSGRGVAPPRPRSSALAKRRLAPPTRPKPKSKDPADSRPSPPDINVIPRDLDSFDPTRTRKALALAHVRTLYLRGAFSKPDAYAHTTLPAFPNLHTLHLDLRTDVEMLSRTGAEGRLDFIQHLRPRVIVFYRSSIWDRNSALALLPNSVLEQAERIVVVLDASLREPARGRGSYRSLRDDLSLGPHTFGPLRLKMDPPTPTNSNAASTSALSSDPAPIPNSTPCLPTSLVRVSRIDIIFYSASPNLPFALPSDFVALMTERRPSFIGLGRAVAPLVKQLEAAGVVFRWVNLPGVRGTIVGVAGPAGSAKRNARDGGDEEDEGEEGLPEDVPGFAEWGPSKTRMYQDMRSYVAEQGEAIFPREDVLRWR